MKYYTDEELNKLEKEQPVSSNVKYFSDADLDKLEMESKKVEKPETSIADKLGSFAYNAGQAAALGFADEAQGVKQAAERTSDNLLRKLFGSDLVDKFNKYLGTQEMTAPEGESLMESIKSGYKTGRDSARESEKLFKEKAPGYALAGSITGSLAPLGSSVLRAANPITYGLLTGSAGGLGRSSGESVTDLLQDTAKGAAIGGTVGVAAKYLPKLISSGAENLKTNLALKSLDVNKTGLKRLGENADEVAEYALRSGIIRPLQSADTKFAKLMELKDVAGSQLSKLRGKGESISIKDVMKAVNEKLKPLNLDSKYNIDTSKIKQAREAIQDIGQTFGREGGKISPTTNIKNIIDLKGKFGEASRKSLGEVNPSKDVLDVIRGGLRQAEISKLGSPEYLKALKDYSSNQTLQEIVKNLQANAGLNALGLTSIGAGAGAGIASGNPLLGLATAGLMSPAGRRAMSAIGAQTMDIGQKAGEAVNPAISRALQEIIHRRRGGL